LGSGKLTSYELLSPGKQESIIYLEIRKPTSLEIPLSGKKESMIYKINKANKVRASLFG